MYTDQRWRPFFIDAADNRAAAQLPPGGRVGNRSDENGQRFCVYHPPHTAAVPSTAASPALGSVVYLHPLAEEMNKSRRMAALQSRALAAAGFAVLQIDLLGCGDSSGDFSDASWAAWLDDAGLAARWLLARHPAPLWLWGLRAGCLLGADTANRLNEAGATGATPCSLLFWQPPAAGNPLLQQFLRLKLAGDMLDGKASVAMASLRSRLDTGGNLSIAGYTLAPALARGLDQARLQPPARAGQAIWIETSTRPEPTLLPASQAAVAAWRAAGHAVQAMAVNGPAFWQTQEIEDAPALLAATTRAMQAACRSSAVTVGAAE